MTAATPIAPPPLPRKKFPRRRVVIGLIIVTGIALVCMLVAAPGGVSRQRQWNAQAEDVGSMIFTPDGRTLFAGSPDAAHAWDPATGASKYTLKAYDAAPSAMAVAPAGNVLACGRSRRVNKTTEQRLETWDLATRTRITSIDHNAHRIAFSPDGKIIATARITNPAGGPALVELWAAPTLTPIAAFPVRPVMTQALGFSPDGKLLALGESPAVQLIDAKSGAPVKALASPTPGFATAVHFSPDGKTLAAVVAIVARQVNHELCVWDTTTGQLKRQVGFDHSVKNACFSADGSRLAVQLYWMGFSRHDRVEVWDTTRGRKLGEVSVGKPWMSSIALSGDGRQLAIGFQRVGLRKPAPIGVWRVNRSGISR